MEGRDSSPGGNSTLGGGSLFYTPLEMVKRILYSWKLDDPYCPRCVTCISAGCRQTRTESIPKLIEPPQENTTLTEQITIPKKPTNKKPSVSKNKIIVNWKHFKNTTKQRKAIWKPIKKVQIQCAADSAFTNIVKNTMVGKKKTKATIKGLAKKVKIK